MSISLVKQSAVSEADSKDPVCRLQYL